MRLTLTAVIAALLLAANGSAQDGYDKAKARYDQCMSRLPLLMKTRGRQALARTSDPRALEILTGSYAKIEAPVDRNQALIVSLCAKYFDSADYVATFDAWRDRFKKAEHAWLWYHSLLIHGHHVSHDKILEIIEKERDPFLRTTAIHALFETRRGEGAEEVARGLLAKLPRNELERSLVVEAVAMGLAERRANLGKEPFNACLSELINLLDDKKTVKRTKLIIARALGGVFNSESRAINAEPWLLQFKAGRNKDIVREGYATTFFDIPASGDRIAYVIDMSDSMLTPLPEKLRNRGRTTGPSKPVAKNKKYDPFVDQYDIPWHKVRNRFDLARENVKLSLYRLKPEKSFAVIGFGDDAGLLRDCTGMMPATKKNIEKVIKGLDEIRPGPVIADRPHGTLRGKTNLHGGLWRAFGVKAKGIVPAFEAVDEKAYFEGADTIFVLSDGDPTWDDYHQVDTNYNEDPIGDPESRTPKPAMENLDYFGPFMAWPLIIDEAQRMNLFRMAEIHCIGIGEVQFAQLERLAKVGHGQSKRIGE